MVQDLQIFAISISFFYNLLVIVMLRQNRMEIRYSLPWIFAGIAMLLFSFYPKISYHIASWLHISKPINVIFFFSIVFLLVTVFILTVIITNLKNKIKKLSQMTSLNQKVLEDITKKVIAEAKEAKQKENSLIKESKKDEEE